MHVTENATAIDDRLVYNRRSTAIVRLRPVNIKNHSTKQHGQLKHNQPQDQLECNQQSDEGSLIKRRHGKDGYCKITDVL
jgi:hypothetical protein